MHQVVFLIGEIDCREGLLVAVERDVYRSIEEGMDATLDIFKDVLKAVIKKRKFKVYNCVPARLIFISNNIYWCGRLIFIRSSQSWMSLDQL